MRCKIVLTLILSGLLAAPGTLGAWDRVGHEVVARIAWEYMTPAARERAAAALLAAPPDAGLRGLLPDGADPETAARLLFQRAAYWPDVVRDESLEAHRYHRGTWHYVNIFWAAEDGGVVELDGWPPAGEAVNRLEFYRCALPGAGGDELGVYVAWLLHIVGDLHQPLHASARVTEREPRGDRGGNDFMLDGRLNLHAYWDRILTSSFERRADETFEMFVERLADWIIDAHPRQALSRELAEPDPAEWALASFRLASTAVYLPGLERGEAPPAGYRERALELASQRLALAGYRIADWLNEALDPDTIPAAAAGG